MTYLLKLMKKILYLLYLIPNLAYASGPFGVNWGQNLDEFGAVVNAVDYHYVTASLSPPNFSLGAKYTLVGNTDGKINAIRVKTNSYPAFSSELEAAYSESMHYLETIGFSNESVSKGKLSSYQCVIHGICEGKAWSGKSADGSKVLLEKSGTNRSRIYVSISFSAPE